MIPPPDPESGDDILPWARAITRLVRQLVPRESKDIWPEVGTTGTKYLLRSRRADRGADQPCWLNDAIYGTEEGYDPDVHYVWMGEGEADFVTAAGCPIARFNLDVEDPDRTKLSLTSGSVDSADDGLFFGTQWGSDGYGFNLSYADGLLATYTRAQASYVAMQVVESEARLHGYANNEAFNFYGLASASEARHSLYDSTSDRYLGLTVDNAQTLIYGYTPTFLFDTKADAGESRSRWWSDTIADYMEASVTTGETTILGYATDEAWNFRLKAFNATGEAHLALFNSAEAEYAETRVQEMLSQVYGYTSNGFEYLLLSNDRESRLALYDEASADYAELRIEELLSQLYGYTSMGFAYLIKADDGESSVTLYDEESADYLQSKVITNDAVLYGYCSDGFSSFRLRAHNTASPLPASALQMWTNVSDPDSAGEYLIAGVKENASSLSGYTDDGAFTYFLGSSAEAALMSVRTVNDSTNIELASLMAKDNEASLFLFAAEGDYNALAKATNLLASLELYDPESANYALLKVTTATGGELWLYHEDGKNNLKYVEGSLQVWGQVDGGDDIYVYLDLRDVEAIKTANTAADLNIKFREIDVCNAAGEPKKQIFLCSAMYDPPAP